MSIKRYTAIKDNTITNAFESNLTTRGTGSNMGRADSLEVFSIFAQASSASNEQTRILVQFPVSSSDTGTTILADRTAGKIPVSGSVNFFLKMFNVAHDQTVPRDFTLNISPISQSWEEGYGLDMENYSDKTYDGTGSTWISAAARTLWTNVNSTTLEGGSYLSASWMGSPVTVYDEFNYKKTFDGGTEDLEINITGLVEQWIIGTASSGYENYGVGIHLTASQESGSRSYYTKKFSARSSEFFFNRPIIEARWDSSRKDQRGSFYVSSSALSSTDNLNTIYFYNYVRGQPKNLPNVETGLINLQVYTSSSGGEQLTTTTDASPMPVTGGWVATGIYSASFALDTTASVVYDRWYSGSIYYHTGSITPETTTPSNIFDTAEYITSITNLRSEYLNNDVARIRLYTRKRNWNPTIYTVATANIENSVIDDVYFKVFRAVDDKDVISYGTGSLNHTRLSYDVSGSYFDLDMSLLEVGFEYGIRFVFYTNGSYDEHNTTFKFKVIE